MGNSSPVTGYAHRRKRARVVLVALVAALILPHTPVESVPQAVAADPNEIVTENALPGTPATVWDVSGAGDPSIQGFATDISVDQGQTVQFKIDTTASNYDIEIYRLGYYAGNGARLVDTIPSTATTAADQPDCDFDSADGNLVDCGNWSVSASWAVPSAAVSGIYIAKPTRADNDGASHIAFVVRDDDGASDLLFQTSDTTWQAYNRYGGYSLYDGPGHAHKVSYNRPFTTRDAPTEDWLMNAEYPMIRWLERNGYDVSYFTDVDSDRNGAEILEHETFLSVGHDEYWSAGQRANVEAARDAGVNLAFFSGNEIYWKTRWETSTADGGSTAYRTLVSYKEGDAQGSEHYDCAGNFSCDPDPAVWTGLWRQNQIGHDGGRPENALSGQISWGDATTAIQVPASATGLRFWRNSGMSGATTLAANTLGYEFDWEQPAFAASYPPGRITLSDTIAVGKNHRMSLYRAPSGALVFGAGTVQWSWGLDGTHDRGSSTEDPRMQQATVNLFSDMGVQPGTLQANLVSGGPLDPTAPSTTITDPAGGATVPGGNVTISGTAADVGGVVAAVEVSTDTGATWTRATGTTSWTYTFSASNGTVTAQARAIDDAANIGTATSVTFAVAAQVCPCSIFTPSTTGAQVADPAAVELGVKFRSDEAGFITGIRFYKTAGNTGTHTGRLWTTTGTILGTVTFAGETATGWQEAIFESPIAIDAATTYVASYHTTSGNYVTGTSFAAAGVDNPPLHALQEGVDGPNGVYQYGAGGVYPTQTFGSSNYLVDVVFVDDIGPDTTAPTIVNRVPSPGASGVAAAANVTATFSEPMAAGSITTSTVELRDPSNALVTATVTYDTATRTAILDPSSALAYSTAYSATVKGGAGGVTDDAVPANPLAADVTWTFTTAAPPPPPPDEGPGGPILVVSSAANPFSRFYVEILRSEGLNAFNAVDVSTVNATMLADYDVVILGEVAIDTTQASMFETWVTGGGNLIAMRPDPDLADLLGLTDTATDLSNAYLQFDTTAGKPGAGLVAQTIQFHGTADRYTLGSGAEALATLYSDASTATANPAVTLRSVGTNGGQAAAFTYDLARSVVYTRQGNPAWAGQERDGQTPPIKRSDDMFYPDWIDFGKIQIPQADEQQRLLANLIELVNRDVMPLPRFWYFPRGEKAVVVMTGDDHGSGGTAGQFDWDISVSPSGCNSVDWECVRGTSYVYPNTPLSDSAAAAYEAQGFEVSVHVDTNCTDWTPSQLEAFYAAQLSQFASAYPSIAAPSTHRTHCITWSDWATQPKVELDHGVRLDTNYYYWPGAWVQDRPGYFTGSGMPMRFADLDGTMIDVYQAATQMPDESGLTYTTHINTLLDNAIGAPGYYGVVTTNMHTDSGTHAGQQTVVNAALAKGVPVVSARQMLTWLDGRNGSSFANLTWNAGTLTFSIARGAGSNGLQAMLPTQGANGSLQTLSRGGNPVAHTTQTIKGVQYATFDATAGAYTAVYAVDATGPVISAIEAVPGAGGTATITWTTDEPSTSRVDYGTSAGSLTSNVSDGTLATSHSLELTGLAPDTTYHFRVTSSDAVPNTTISPNPPALPATFATPTAVATDTTVADFSAGTTGGSTYVSDTAGGEVILSPTVGAEFSGTNLPSGWSTGSWNAGSSNVVAGGTLTVDGSWIRSDPLVSAGGAVEFVATFSGAAFQNAGFGVTLNAGGESWAMFGTNATAGILQARTVDSGGPVVDVALGAQYIGAPHLFRIEWDTAVRFYIDGALVHTAASVSGTMRPIASDFNAGGGALSINWMRLTPYASPGTFLSRIHDAGSPAADWGALSYVADVPSGATLGLEVRTGETPSADGSWSSFAATASGADVLTSGRYLQYRVAATSTGQVTPTLESVTLPYRASADTTAPTITGRTPAPNNNGVAIGTDVTVTFDEPMDPATITSSTVTLRAVGAGVDVPATVSYAGTTATLDPTGDLLTSTDYTVTVAASVADTSGNQLGTANAWMFTTSAPLSSLMDTTAAEFGAGSTGPNTYVSSSDDGEVILAPTVGAEFNGTNLPGGWESGPWTGGSAMVSGGSLTVDGAYARTTALYDAGLVLEFRATFGDTTFHNAGLGVDLNNVATWAVFGVGNSSGQLYARVAGTLDVPLGAALLGTPHTYRIEWAADAVRFYVDGLLVRTAGAIAGQMRPIVSDLNVGGPVLSVDWLHMSPYAASGTFTSRVLDALGAATWSALEWSASTPAGTSLGLSYRTGDSIDTSSGWSAFEPVAASGDPLTGTSRYIQYRAVLSTTDSTQSPTLSSVTVQYIAGPPDNTAPSVIARTPLADATGVPIDTNVSATFDEPIDPSTLTTATVTLRAQGAGADVQAAVTYNAATTIVTLDPTADLAGNTLYTATLGGAIADSSGNPLGSDVSWTFRTVAIAASFTDTTAAHFGAGVLDANTYVTETADGEVTLAPTVGAEFSGTNLPSGWTSTLWSNDSPGGATIAGGSVVVDGGRTGPTTATTGPGHSLEFIATFTGQPFQHVGFVSDFGFNAPWAIFSTGSAGGALLARSSNAGDTPIPGSWLNAPHRYRIDWTPTGFVYFIDGNEVAAKPFETTGPMRPLISDANAGGGAVTVDWLRMSPYSTSGTFESRIFDAGAAADWGALSWTASTPAGTSLAMSYRTGNSPTLDGTWSAFQPISASGEDLAGTSRYIQYRAALSTSNAAETPALENVTIAYTESTDTLAPTVTIDQAAGQADPTGTSPVHFTVTFSESVADFDSGDVTLTGTAGATIAVVTGTGTTYDVAVSGMTSDGTVTASIAAGAANDAAGNDSAASTSTDNTVTLDTTSPTTTITTTAGTTTATSPIPVTVTFSEPVSGFTASDVTTTNAAVANFTGSGAGYAFDLVAAGDGLVSVDVAAGVAADGAGNPNTAAATLSRTVDTAAPSVALASAATDPTNAASFAVSITFSEPVTGLELFDLVVANGTASGLTGSDGDAAYSVTITPAGDGLVSVDLAAAAAADAATNPSTAATTLSRTVDTAAPTVTIDQAAGQADPTGTSPVHFTVTFSESVADFDSGDVTLSGTAGATTAVVTGSGTTYDVAVSGMASSGTVVASLPAGAVHDAASNANLASTSTDGSITFDTNAPSVAITTTASDPTNATSLPFAATFSEVVTGFSLADIDVTNGTATNLAGSGTTYTFDISPADDGLVTVEIAAGVATSAAGNGNSAAEPVSITFDGTAPSVAMSSTSTNPTSASSIPVTATFSEPVSGFDSTDIDATNATVSGFASVSGSEYTFDLVPAGEGLVSANIGAGSAADAATNPNTAAPTFSRTVDLSGPTVTMTSTATDPTNAALIPVVVEFSDPVTDFEAADITAGNASVTNFAGSGASYAFDLVPAGDGLVTADIAAGVAHDSAGNGNSAAETLSRTVDKAGPSVTITSATGDPTNATTIPVSVTFSESVTGFTSADVSVGNASVGSFAGSGAIYTFNLVPNGEGLVTVDIAAGAATDAAGNASQAATTFSRTIDRTAPSIALTNPTNGSTTGDQTPSLSGTAGIASGDLASVTVRIYAGSLPSGTPVQVLTAPVDGGTGAYSVDAAILAYGTYTARASQGDAAGNAGQSGPTTFTIIDTTPPAAPTGLSVVERLSTGLRLDWATNGESDLAGYDIFRAASAGGPFTKLNPTNLTSSDFLDTTAEPGVAAFYEVRAVDLTGNVSDPATTDAIRPTIAFRSVSTGQNGTASSLVLARPAGAVAGDLLVATITLRSGATISAPAGWTLIQNTVSGTALRQAIYYRVATAGPPASFGWSFSSSVAAAGAITAYSGIDTANPIDVSSGQANTSSASITAPVVVTTVPDALLVGAFGTATNATVAPAAGMLEQFEALTSGKNKVAVEGADEIRATIGATGNRVASADKAAVNIGQLVAFRPLDAPPPGPDTTNPSTPGNVQAVAASQTRVNLTWSPSADNVGVDHYEIFRNADTTVIGTSTTTSFSDMNAIAGTTYTYRVVAVDAATNRSGDGVSNAVTTPSDPPPPPAGITFRSASYKGAKASSVTVPGPAGLAAGDVMLATVDVLGQPTITAPTGWTLVETHDNGSVLRKATYVRVASASEPASYVWAFSASTSVAAGIHAYSGVDIANPIDVFGGQANARSTTLASPSVDVTADGAVLVLFLGVAANTSVTPPAGHDERGEVIGGSGSARVTSEGSDDPHGIGPSGTHAGTSSKEGVSISHVIVLRPAQ